MLRIALSSLALCALFLIVPGCDEAEPAGTVAPQTGGGAAPPSKTQPPPGPPIAPPTPSAPADPGQPAKPSDATQFVQWGPVRATVPGHWRIKASKQPPKHSLHVTPGPNVTCDLGLIEGHGTPEQAEGYLSGAAAAYDGDVTRNEDLQLAERTFQGIHVEKPKALAGAGEAVVDIFVTIVGSDLVGLGFTSFQPGPETEELRANCRAAFTTFVKGLP